MLWSRSGPGTHPTTRGLVSVRRYTVTVPLNRAVLGLTCPCNEAGELSVLGLYFIRDIKRKTPIPLAYYLR